MNINNIDRIYNKYAKMNQDTSSKGYDEEYVAYIDCVQLMRKDSLMKISTRIIKEAFAMCKMTVLDELSHEGQSSYLKLNKVEFLEFIARASELFFKESEMEELPLYEKVEHVLDDILPIIGAKRVKQEVTVEEFSDSDDDY